MHCGCSSQTRSFWTKKEKIAMLNEYKEDLESELQGVNEKIKQLEA